MLGPIIAILTYNSINENRACWPVSFRNLGLIVIGYSMGSTINHETTNQILVTLPSIFMVTMLTIIFSVVLGYFTHRQTGISFASGILGSMPGGLTQMVLLTEEIKDTDLTVVTIMQTVRLLAVVFIVPFIATYGIAHPPISPLLTHMNIDQSTLFRSLPSVIMAPIGAWLAYRLKLPTPFLVGPIFSTAVAVLFGYEAAPVPRIMLNMAQIFLGIYMGLGITMNSIRQLGKLLPYAIIGAVTLVVFTLLLGFCLTFFIPATLLTNFLSLAPGGMPEMGVTAITLHADIATVLAYQLFRLFFVLLVVPPLLKWKFNR